MSLTANKTSNRSTQLEVVHLPELPQLDSLNPGDREKLRIWWTSVREVLSRVERKIDADTAA
jgi:hypothetical protein